MKLLYKSFALYVERFICQSILLTASVLQYNLQNSIVKESLLYDYRDKKMADKFIASLKFSPIAIILSILTIPRILRDKTMDDELQYIPINDKQITSLLVE